MAIAKLSKWSLFLTAATALGDMEGSSLLQLQSESLKAGVEDAENLALDCNKLDAHNHPLCKHTITKPPPTTPPPTTPPVVTTEKPLPLTIPEEPLPPPAKPLPPRNGPVRRCKIYGDPHIESFNGAFSAHIVVGNVHIRDSVNYNAGTFWLVRAPEVQIQGVFSGEPRNYLTKLMVSGSAVDNKLLVMESVNTNRTLTFDGTTYIDPHFTGSFGSGNGAIEVQATAWNRFKFLIKSARLDIVTWVMHEHLHAEIFMNEGEGLEPGLCGRFQSKADDIEMLTSNIGYVKPGEQIGSFPVVEEVAPPRHNTKLCDDSTKLLGNQCCEAKISATVENRIEEINACVFDYCIVGESACQEDATFVNSIPEDMQEAMIDLPPTTFIACQALSAAVSDDWCTTNCHHVPANCPSTLCECDSR